MNNAPIRHSPPGPPAEEPYGTHEQQPYGLYNPVYKAPSDYHYNSLEQSISDSVLNDQEPHSGYSSAPSPQNFSTSDYPTSQWQHSPNQRNEYGYHVIFVFSINNSPLPYKNHIFRDPDGYKLVF